MIPGSNSVHTEDNIKEKVYGGKIAALGLVDFWKSLLEDERNRLRFYETQKLIGGGAITAIDDPKIKIIPREHMTHSAETASKYLHSTSTFAISEKRYDLAERMLLESLNHNPTAIDIHFTYNGLIEVYYKQRVGNEKWIDKCVEICQKDILLFPEFKREWMQWSGDKEFKLLIPAFIQLAIIYEKKGLYQEAIEISQLALSYGLNDWTKNGFSGRISKLKKKLKR